MKTLRRALLLSLLAAVLLLIFSFFLPASVHVEKTAVINASAKSVYNQIVNTNRWQYWMPNATAGSPFEVAKSQQGNRLSHDTKIIDGVATITSSEPYQEVNTLLQLNQYGIAEQQFNINETDTGTYLTWTVDFQIGNNPLDRIYGLFLDQLVSGDITEALKNLKNIAENNGDASAGK